MKKDQPVLTIGEVAKTIGITRRIIINYEDHGLIQADTRGEFDSGYRYYTMDTLVRIHTIRIFQKLGLSLDEIKQYLDDCSDLTPALKRLEMMRDELDINIERIRERLNPGAQMQIRITELSEYTAYCRTLRDTTLEDRTNHLRDTAYMAISSHGTDISKRMYFTECPLNDPELTTYYAAVPAGSVGEGIVQLPQVKALVKYHHGSYRNLFESRDELVAYAKANGIKLTGVCRHIFLEGPPQHKDPRNFITMVALLIEQ